ncbi:tetratricopeptide repeat protein [Treponema primitia ZAS-2]|uniref:Tetratricopeptide repeat protein n=1 Tax=Treponema primitia (strain ATCC BAA-887 / DSM 12427 / ZAS-2) TaxID=545694 RepID=F5YP33_TREPZ|nr:tetratricopeptide repeat protein [Treponema primitia]AEF84723.1 tetratricopeptide repeat protein [Treponema primitia ZAS-2]
MSKYNLEINYLFMGADISEEEIAEIITEADRITLENNETPEKIAEAYLKKSQCLQKLGKRQESREPLEKALELAPAMAEAITQLGNILHGEENYDEAIARYTEAIQLKPDYAAAFNNRGVSFAGKGEYNKAIADYTEAIQLKPDYAIAYYNRGNKYRNIGKFEQALVDREEAIRLKPGLKDLGMDLPLDIVLRHIVGSDADEIFEMYNDAEKVIKEEKEKPEKIAETYLKQSLYLFLNEKEENGKEAIKKAADLYSGMDEADVIVLKSDLVRALNVHGTTVGEGFDEGIAEWTDVIGKNSWERAIFFNNRGNTFIEKGRYIKAFSAWQEAMQLEKTSDESKIIFDQAIADYTKAMVLNKSTPRNFARMLKNRSIAYIEIGAYDKAIADCDEALALSKDEGVFILYHRGIAYDASGDREQAIADYSRAIELAPCNYEMLFYELFYSRGLAHDEKGEYELAIADYTQAICIAAAMFSPGDAFDAYCNRGLVYKALGQRDKAEADFAKLDGKTAYKRGRKKGILSTLINLIG